MLRVHNLRLLQLVLGLNQIHYLIVLPTLLQVLLEALELPLLAVPTGGEEYHLSMEAALRRAESDLEVRGMEMNVSTAEAARARAHARIRAVKLWRENG